MHPDVERRRHLLGGRADVVDPAAEVEPVACALVDRVVAAHSIGMRLAQPLEPEAVTHLLVGRRSEDHVAGRLEALTDERGDRHRIRRDLPLHVERPSPPDARPPALVILELARERRDGPLMRVGEHDVGVGEQEQRRPVQRAKWGATADYQSSFSGGGDVSNLRNDVKLSTTRQLRNAQNFYMGMAEFLQSNEQQLDLRTTLGGSVGHVFSNTNNSFVTGFGGVVWNREQYSSEATTGQTGDSAEAVLGTQLNFFRFKTTNILANASVYPSITDPGRVRFNLNTSVKLRIAKDLYWNFGYFLDVDSRPPQNLPKTDYGSTSGLGWTF